MALYDGSSVLSETTWLAGREHSTRLLVETEIALERIGRGVGDLTGVVVARGPGSFTGVRVALSVAKGIASGLHLPAYGVSSLEVVAYMVGPIEVPVRAVLEAGRGRYATALYAQRQLADAPRLATIAQLRELIREKTLLIGEVSAQDRELLSQEQNVSLAPVAASARRAGYLAELGWRMAQRGEPADPAALDALYIT